ncbi:hypothetical protein C8F04DRAFT_1128450 [Mycena alexandri]|uniref:Uncharacterized protein n=1 Tax=Mycena alexandri TaxID=1745969 RepID=A0AAD6SCQ3_9AGAR|nr:hypothetical protein C8F04DRAFT_1128450 [Mycena alexandri]
MVSTMRGNKEDLVKLKKHLDTLDAVDSSNMGGDLKQRVETLKKELHLITTDHKKLAKREKFMRFFDSKGDKEAIQNMQNSIVSCIQDFTFYGTVSIEKLVGDMVAQVQEIQKNVDSMAPQVDQVQQEAILARLTYISAQYNAANTPDTCMKGTRSAENWTFFPPLLLSNWQIIAVTLEAVL